MANYNHGASSSNETNDSESFHFDEIKSIADTSFNSDFMPLEKKVSILAKSLISVIRKHKAVEQELQEIKSATKKPKLENKGNPCDFWDAGKVLDYFAEKIDNVQADTKSISKKLFILLGLTVPFNSDNIRVENNITEFDKNSYIIAVLKNDKDANNVPYTVKISNHSKPPELGEKVLSRYTNNKICPVDTLNSYLSRTMKIRETIKTKSLFITLSDDPKPVTNFSKWISAMLNKYQVNTSKCNDPNEAGTSAKSTNKQNIDYELIFEKAQYPPKYEEFKKFYGIIDNLLD